MSSSIIVRESFIKNFRTVHENDAVSKCLSQFGKQMPPVLAVLDSKKKYVGVITRRAIIRSGLDPASTKVKTLMRRAPKVDPSIRLSKAAKLMIESGVRQLPVFEGKKLVGLISDEKIIHKAVIQQWGNAKVKQIMTRAPKTIEGSLRPVASSLNFRE